MKYFAITLLVFACVFKPTSATCIESGVIFSDNFDAYTAGTFPSIGGWQLLYDGAGASQQFIDNNRSVTPPSSLHLAANTYCWAATALHPVSISENVVVEFNVSLDQIVTCGCSPYLIQVGLDYDYGYVSFECDGKIYSRDNGSKVLLTTFTAGKWYNVKVICDFDTLSFDVYIDGVKYASNFRVPNSGLPTIVYVSAGHGDRPVAWFDDVRVYAKSANLNLKGDVNGDNQVDLEDTISSLQLIGRYSVTEVQLSADVDNDGRIGLAEAIFCQNIVSSNWALPGAPIIGTASAGDGQATVNFQPPVSDGGRTISEYIVTSYPGAITASGTKSPITVTGLANGTSYTFAVKAVNVVGAGTESAVSNAVIPAPPVAISGYWQLYHTNESNVLEDPPEYWSISQSGASLTMEYLCDDEDPLVQGTISGTDIVLSWYSSESKTTTTLAGTWIGDNLSGTWSDTAGNSGFWWGSRVSQYSCQVDQNNTYQVYGGNSYISGAQGYTPQNYGYVLLGSASTTATFTGSYSYYAIVTNPPNIAYVDTVGSSDGIYYTTYTTGNSTFWANVGGAPDGLACLVGGLYDGEAGGYILIAPTEVPKPASVTVYIAN